MFYSEKIVEPGNIVFSDSSLRLRAIVTYGIALTLHYEPAQMGLMGHFIYSRRKSEEDNNSLFAAPNIVKSVECFTEKGIDPKDLEVHCVGAAHLQGSALYSLTMETQQVCEEIVSKLGLRVSSYDLGGHRARKILFHTQSGELLIAKVNKVRKEDWVYTGGLPLQRDQTSTERK